MSTQAQHIYIYIYIYIWQRLFCCSACARPNPWNTCAGIPSSMWRKPRPCARQLSRFFSARLLVVSYPSFFFPPNRLWCGNLKTEFVTFIRHSYCQKCPATVEVAAPSLKTYCFACTRPPFLKKQAFHLHGNTHISTGRGAYFSRPKIAHILMQSGVFFLVIF